MLEPFALNAIRSQALRTTLTVLIIAFGIMALVGILTAIDAIKNSISSSFSSMGSNSFTVRNAGLNIHVGGNNKKREPRKKSKYFTGDGGRFFKPLCIQ